MSGCSNLTNGIARGCNDQVGGITGVHATLAYHDGINPPDNGIVVGNVDQNMVITRISSYDPSQQSYVNSTWNWVEADNGRGNLTETYNIGGTGNILGFHQSLKFFIPTTAEPSVTTLPYSHTLQNWVKLQAGQNNLVIGVELDHHNPGISYEPKCFVFGLKRVGPGIEVILPDFPPFTGHPAYFASGDKQTGIAYGDDNGYTIEIAANSKQPMFEASYMSLHTNQSTRYYLGTNQGTDLTNSIWNLSGLEYFLGANIRQLGTTGMFPEIYVMPGERLTVGGYVTADWVADVTTNNGFQVEAYIGATGEPTDPVLTTVGFTGSGAGVAEAYFTGSWENTTNNIIGVHPLRLRATNGFTGNLNNPPFSPYVRFDQITRTTRS